VGQQVVINSIYVHHIMKVNLLFSFISQHPCLNKVMDFGVVILVS
jgi:hypothetical protein